jgi:hypothetical protein
VPGEAGGARQNPSKFRTGPLDSGPPGRVAQWESARFTRERTVVRNHPRPSRKWRLAGICRTLTETWPAKSGAVGAGFSGFVRADLAVRSLPSAPSSDTRELADSNQAAPMVRQVAVSYEHRIKAAATAGLPRLHRCRRHAGPIARRRAPDLVQAALVRAHAETPAACQRSSSASDGVGFQRLLRFAQPSSERTLDPVRRDNSFPSDRSLTPRACWSSNSGARRAASGALALCPSTGSQHRDRSGASRTRPPHSTPGCWRPAGSGSWRRCCRARS